MELEETARAQETELSSVISGLQHGCPQNCYAGVPATLYRLLSSILIIVVLLSVYCNIKYSSNKPVT